MISKERTFISVLNCLMLCDPKIFTRKSKLGLRYLQCLDLLITSSCVVKSTKRHYIIDDILDEFQKSNLKENDRIDLINMRLKNHSNYKNKFFLMLHHAISFIDLDFEQLSIVLNNKIKDRQLIYGVYGVLKDCELNRNRITKNSLAYYDLMKDELLKTNNILSLKKEIYKYEL